jgi:hypothetical protein
MADDKNQDEAVGGRKQAKLCQYTYIAIFF